MIQTLGDNRITSIAGTTILFTLNVPLNEKWIIVNIRTITDYLFLTYIDLLINQDTRIRTIPTTQESGILLNEIIVGGTNIQLNINKLTADAQQIGAFIDIERIKG